MVEEGRAALDRVRHLGAVAEEVQELVREGRLEPEPHRLVERIARSALGQIEPVQEHLIGIAARELLREAGREQRPDAMAGDRARADPGRHVAEHALHRVGVERRARGRTEGAVLPIGGAQLRDPRARDVGVLARRSELEHVLAEEGIAAEQLVGAFAGQHHLEAEVAHLLAEQVLGDEVRVAVDRLAVPDGVGEVIGEQIFGHPEHVEVRARLLRHLRGDRALVEGAFLEGDREGLERRAVDRGGVAEDGARIEAAREVDADRHVGAQPQADRLLHLVVHALDVLGFAAHRRGLVGGRILEIPVGNDLDALARRQQVVPRRHLIDALEHRAIAVGDHVEVLIHRLVIPARRHAGGEERLDLGGEVERVARRARRRAA